MQSPKFDQVQGSSDGGAVLLKAADRELGLIAELASCLKDDRQEAKVRHELDELLTQRVMAIACGYEDADDLDSLRSDPAFKLACGRLEIHFRRGTRARARIMGYYQGQFRDTDLPPS